MRLDIVAKNAINPKEAQPCERNWKSLFRAKHLIGIAEIAWRSSPCLDAGKYEFQLFSVFEVQATIHIFCMHSHCEQRIGEGFFCFSN